MEELRDSVGSILSRVRDHPVDISTDIDVLDTAWGTETPTVVRCRDELSGESVIVKRYVPFPDEHPQRAWAEWGNANEHAGLRYLGELGLEPPIAPAFIGGDDAGTIALIEDLGDGPSLDKLLLGDDPVAASEALVGFARTLGRMHAATRGRIEEYREVRSRGFMPEAELHIEIDERIALFLGACERLDVNVGKGAMDEIGDIRSALETPGPFLAYTHGDPCPDNTRIVDGEVRLFDFEMGGFRHALLDGAYVHAPFPTCWCVNKLPVNVWPDALDAYRTELIVGCPEAADDKMFDQALATAWAYWTIDCTGEGVNRTLDADVPWGVSTNRQRVFHRWDTFASGVETTGLFVEVERLGRHIVTALRDCWPDTEPMPVYPAFR
jgi:hypothetical protein